MDGNLSKLRAHEEEQEMAERLTEEAYTWFNMTYTPEEFETEEEYADVFAQFEFDQISFYLENK